MKSYPPTSHASQHRWLILLTLLLALVVVLPIGQRAERQDQRPQRQQPAAPLEQTKNKQLNAVPGEILVRFRPGSKGRQLGRQVVVEKTGRQIQMSIKAVTPALEIVEGLRVAQVSPADTSNAIEALRARADVVYAEPNFIRKAMALPNDPRYPEMWGLNNTGQPSTFGGNPGTAGNDIRAEQAWNITTGNRSVVVGVIDTGIDINHEDLKDNIWTNPAEIAGNGIDDDGNGFVDDIHGWDFAHNDATVFDYTLPTFPPPDTYTGDLDDHGTHVGGTIGATGNNATGVVGVNWQVSLMSLKFLSEDGAGSTSDLLNAFAYAKAMRQLWQSSGGTKGANLRILNNSYGGDNFSQAELDAIRALSDAGILFVVSAGNEGAFNDLFPVYPSNYISPNLISVAASGGGGARASFSNWGEATVNMMAPGEFILSTTPKNTYKFANGTSMAAPHVSGSAALVCALSPNITMQKLRSVMMYSGRVTSGFLDVFPISTGRVVDASRALQSLSSTDVTPPGAINIVSFFNTDNSTSPSYSFSWLAPGDDGNTGKIAAYEIRFSDTTLNDANFDLAIPLRGPAPNDAGAPNSVTVKIPWRHASGFIGIRAVDEVGNKGPITSIVVPTSADVGDPYTMAESAATPLSTGGTALGLMADDDFKPFNLPFTFKFFGTEWHSVAVSTNGALYLGFQPSEDDPFSSVRTLSGTRMIAGLWDDLRTDRRAGDDVYVVQDSERIIFRWQAVTFDNPISATTTRGENPVSFEIELRFDGTITMRYGDGNQKLLPVVGIGGGSPEPYVSTSHTFSNSLKDLTNAGTVVFTRRNPVPRGVLTVNSTNPSSGVNITVSPNDSSGSNNGITPFALTYNPGTTVTLTAPATVNGNKFQLWLRDGQDWSGSLTTTVAMNTNLNITMTAVYFTPPVLTVNSSNPNSGVNITVSPNDNNGAGNGTTPFTRTYNLNTGVTLVAPATQGTSTFWKWQLDGVDYTPAQSAPITMAAAHTLTALYITATPTPTPTPVPGAGAQPIAFVKPGNGGAADVFLTNTDGTNIVNFTGVAGDDTRPAWSPDGLRLAYTCLRQPDGSIASPQRICVRNADGTGFTVLSKLLQDESGPTWSRDGSQIAFTTGSGSESVITIVNVDGTGFFPLAIFSGAANPDLHPDGWRLVFDLVNSIWTYNRLTQTGLRLTNLTGDSRPRYSPDASKIVFQSLRDGQAEIYVMNADGTSPTRLTNNSAADTAPAWSPDGTKILFTSLRDGPTSPALYVMNADGSNQTRVTAGSDGVWRPAPTTPVIFTEEGTNNAAAFNSVTFVRGPFRIRDPHNFSFDGQARVMLFTSNLGLMSPPIPAASILTVKANGVILQVQNVGPVTGVSGMNASYIIVRLPDGLPTGNLSLTVTLRGVTSAPAILPIAP